MISWLIFMSFVTHIVTTYCDCEILLVWKIGPQQMCYSSFSPLNATLAEQRKLNQSDLSNQFSSHHIYSIIKFTGYNQQFKLLCQYFYCKRPARTMFSILMEASRIKGNQTIYPTEPRVYAFLSPYNFSTSTFQSIFKW